ncbi:head decoration protein [Saccharopolyspora sp. 6T]|uniref:head decoration protein n=1 Tax=Saccharopolyspora sp. 6T TaxID=2877238 RepID=UPI001CD4F727|nr:head decoration protein [Saccharopolyspora sp. 6T]MCA1185713.1 head decoration protein [Saccharopolyspora sp. 6T]
MDLKLSTESFAADDQSWLGSRDGVEYAHSVTLNTSSFTAGTHYPNGFFPSGLPLGRITASGLAGPYDSEATDGRENFIGFLLFSLRTPKDGTSPVVGAVLERGRVVVDRLPVEFTAPDTDRFLFV